MEDLTSNSAFLEWSHDYPCSSVNFTITLNETEKFTTERTNYTFENLTASTVYNISIQACASDNYCSERATTIFTTLG